MFLNQSIVSSPQAILLLALGFVCIVATTALETQTDPGCDFGPDALTNAFGGKSIPRTCIDVPFDNGDTTGVLERCYYTYVPDSSSCRDKKVPLVVDIHARDGCPAQYAKYSGWMQKAEEECFALVMPSAYVDYAQLAFAGSCFNLPGWARADDYDKEGGNHVTASPCCCESKDAVYINVEEPNDPLFLKMAIDNVVEYFGTGDVGNNGDVNSLTIDTNRIYMAGHSNGCVASFAMAALYSDTIAAVCCHVGYVTTPFPKKYSPVPIWMVYGEQDERYPYDGWTMDVPDFGLVGFWSVAQTWEYLLTKNECSQQSQSSMFDANGLVGTTFKGTNCQQNIEIVALTESGHSPYLIPGSDVVPRGHGGSPTTIDTTQLAWEFCSAQSRTDGGSFYTGTDPSSVTSTSDISYVPVGDSEDGNGTGGDSNNAGDSTGGDSNGNGNGNNESSPKDTLGSPPDSSSSGAGMLVWSFPAMYIVNLLYTSVLQL